MSFHYEIPCPGGGTTWIRPLPLDIQRRTRLFHRATTFKKITTITSMGLQPPGVRLYLDFVDLSQCFCTNAFFVIFLLNCKSDLKSLTKYLREVNSSRWFTFKAAQHRNSQYGLQLPKYKRRLYQYIYLLSGRRQKLNLPGFPPLHSSLEKRKDNIFWHDIFHYI